MFFFFFAFVAFASSGALSSAAGAPATAAGSEAFASSGGFSGAFSTGSAGASASSVAEGTATAVEEAPVASVPSSSAFAPSPDSPAFPEPARASVFVVTTVVVTFFAGTGLGFRVAFVGSDASASGATASTGVSAADGASASGASAASAVSDVPAAESSVLSHARRAFTSRRNASAPGNSPSDSGEGGYESSESPSFALSIGGSGSAEKAAFSFAGVAETRRRQLDRLAQELELGSNRLGRRAPLGRALAHRRVSLLLQRA